MEIVIQQDSGAACLLGARIIARLIKRKPDCVLGLATGSTPLPLYRFLIDLHRQEGLDFSRVTTFNLDEYIGLDRGHPSSYYTFMHSNFFDHINIDKKNIHIPDGLAADIPVFCQQYEKKIKVSGGVDLQLLGIGTDGHIGFNEPSSSLASRTRIKTLTRQTVEDNAPYFAGQDNVPRHVITMGIGTILESRTCLLLAFGEKKAEAVLRTVEGPVTAMVPASVLQMHPNTTILLDEGSAARLKRRDYYRWVYDHKPEWQRYNG